MTLFVLMLRATAARVARLTVGTALGLSLVLSLAGAPVQAQVQPAQGQGPALWAIRDADSTIYLFGTVHVLRPTTAWGSPKVDAAFASATDVWFEVSNPDDVAAIVPFIRQYGLSPNRPLPHLITSGELTLLDNAARTVGLTAVQMEPFRPWYAGVTLSVASLIEAGYDPKSGVERVFQGRAVASGTPVRGFETLDKQISILAGLSEETQLAFLVATLREYQDASTELDALVAAWAAGDVEAIDRTAVQEMKSESEEVYQALLVNRNADWAGQIQTLLAGSGTAFIAVGAAHLAGDDSVQSMLEDRGVTVTRE